MAIVSNTATAQAPIAQKSVYYGRWTVSEDSPFFSARGRLYKTIDVAPCGKDFCGISVNDNGTCGTTLFRFFGFRAKSDDALKGNGKWGNGKKNLLMYINRNTPEEGSNSLQIYLGQGYDFGERSSSMPTYEAEYKPLGAATCRTK